MADNALDKVYNFYGSMFSTYQVDASPQEENKQNDQHQRERRSVNSPGFMRFVNKHNNPNVPGDEQPDGNEKQRVIEVGVFYSFFVLLF